MAMLEVNDINVYYGNIHAIKGVSFHVNEGEIISLIGANGAGKTTTLQTISGLLRSKTGSIKFMDQEISHLPAYKLPALGLAQVPEGRRVFLQMSVEENLELGAYTLSGGEQQMLAMGRAMMSHPKMLMLDEPSMGLAPLLVEEIFELIKLLNESGTTILLVEQNAQMALSIADRGYVLETGRIVSTADAKELLNDDAVRKAYLGG